LTIDVSTNWSSGPWSAFCAYCASLSRSGPVCPFELAGLYVWQPAQPSEAKNFFPWAGSPFGSAAVVVCGSVPSTACAVGPPMPWPPHPASSGIAAKSTRNGRRIGA
jgi:hypothetical protein